jgi:hypothetical protein
LKQSWEQHVVKNWLVRKCPFSHSGMNYEWTNITWLLFLSHEMLSLWCGSCENWSKGLCIDQKTKRYLGNLAFKFLNGKTWTRCRNNCLINIHKNYLIVLDAWIWPLVNFLGGHFARWFIQKANLRARERTLFGKFGNQELWKIHLHQDYWWRCTIVPNPKCHNFMS